MSKTIRIYQDQNRKLYLLVGEEGKTETLYQKIETLSLYEFRQLLNDIQENVLINFGALGIEKASNAGEAEGTLLANQDVTLISKVDIDDLAKLDFTPIQDFFDNSEPYANEYTVTRRKHQNQKQPNQASQNQDPLVNAKPATVPEPNPVDNPLLENQNTPSSVTTTTEPKTTK